MSRESSGYLQVVSVERWPTVSDDVRVQDRYAAMRAAGESHSMAEMLATRSFPGLKGTDAVFMEGRKLGGQQFESLPRHMGQMYLEEAAKANVNVSGKYYLGTVARFPGDPKAWVSGLGDVRRIAKERGVAVVGAVNIDAPKYADGYVPPEKYRVDDSIVAEHVDNVIGERPASLRELADVRESVAKRLSGVHGKGV